MSEKKVKFPCIGIYARYANGGKWSANEPYKTPDQAAKIKSRLIAWQARNPGNVQSLTLYNRTSPSSQEIIFQNPREFRLWLKYDFNHSTQADNPDTGISIIREGSPDPGKDLQIIGRLAAQAISRIYNGVLWQARIYNPANQTVFDWSNLAGFKIGAEYLHQISF